MYLYRKLGFRVIIEQGAGNSAGFSDSEYSRLGAEVGNANQIYNEA